MSITVRCAVCEDAERIAEIDGLCFSEPISVDGARRMIGDPDMLVKVLCDDGGILSYCSAMKVLDEIQIVNVATDPAYGGRGYARELLSKIFGEVSSEGIVTVSLEVRVSNDWAIRLYEGLGFARVGLRKSFYRKPTEDAIVMLLSL